MPDQRYLVLLGMMLQVRVVWPSEPALPPHHLKSWMGGGDWVPCLRWEACLG